MANVPMPQPTGESRPLRKCQGCLKMLPPELFFNKDRRLCRICACEPLSDIDRLSAESRERTEDAIRRIQAVQDAPHLSEMFRVLMLKFPGGVEGFCDEFVTYFQSVKAKEGNPVLRHLFEFVMRMAKEHTALSGTSVDELRKQGPEKVRELLERKLQQMQLKVHEPEREEPA